MRKFRYLEIQGLTNDITNAKQDFLLVLLFNPHLIICFYFLERGKERERNNMRTKYLLVTSFTPPDCGSNAKPN